MNKTIDWEKWNSKDSNFLKDKDIESNIIYGEFASNIPEVSIMIITYKRADGLKHALDSALNQTFQGMYEIVVVDDSGFDQETDDLMKEYCSKYNKIVYYRHDKNLGQYANWNRACELSRTEWYCLLHDDDEVTEKYLEKIVPYAFCEENNLGLIGSYMEVMDRRDVAPKKSIINRLVNVFIALRGGKPILLTLDDNMNHIFVLSCCLFINKTKALELGGLNDSYFPSSDFVMAAKMNYYYSTAFLPVILSRRGIGENESLKQEVCNDSIRCAYNMTFAMGKTKKMNQKIIEKKSSYAAVMSEIGVKGYNDIDYGLVKTQLGMKASYNRQWKITFINFYSKFKWGSMLFRKNKLKRKDNK